MPGVTSPLHPLRSQSCGLSSQLAQAQVGGLYRNHSSPLTVVTGVPFGTQPQRRWQQGGSDALTDCVSQDGSSPSVTMLSECRFLVKTWASHILYCISLKGSIQYKVGNFREGKYILLWNCPALYREKQQERVGSRIAVYQSNFIYKTHGRWTWPGGHDLRTLGCGMAEGRL